MSDLELPISFYGIAQYLFHRYRTLVASGLVGAALLGTFAVVRPAYRAESTFTPVVQDQSALGGLSSLASQFGFNLNAVTGGQPLELYADLVTSPTLLAKV